MVKKEEHLKLEQILLKDEILNKIHQDDKLKKYLNGKEMKKKIFIPNKLINIII